MEPGRGVEVGNQDRKEHTGEKRPGVLDEVPVGGRQPALWGEAHHTTERAGAVPGPEEALRWMGPG